MSAIKHSILVVGGNGFLGKQLHQASRGAAGGVTSILYRRIRRVQTSIGQRA